MRLGLHEDTGTFISDFSNETVTAQSHCYFHSSDFPRSLPSRRRPRVTSSRDYSLGQGSCVVLCGPVPVLCGALRCFAVGGTSFKRVLHRMVSELTCPMKIYV